MPGAAGANDFGARRPAGHHDDVAHAVLGQFKPCTALSMAQHHIDVIMSDQRMAGMTGVEFLRAAKAKYPETIRIILSGYAELQYVTEAINEGAIYRFLSKPWDDGQLREQVEKAYVKFLEVADRKKRVEDQDLISIHESAHIVVTR